MIWTSSMSSLKQPRHHPQVKVGLTIAEECSALTTNSNFEAVRSLSITARWSHTITSRIPPFTHSQESLLMDQWRRMSGLPPTPYRELNLPTAPSWLWPGPKPLLPCNPHANP